MTSNCARCEILKPTAYKSHHYSHGIEELPIITRVQLDDWLARAKELLDGVKKGELDPFEASDTAGELEEEFGNENNVFYLETYGEHGNVRYIYSDSDELSDELEEIFCRVIMIPDPYPEEELERTVITDEMCLHGMLDLAREEGFGRRYHYTVPERAKLRLYRPPNLEVG